MKDWGYTFDSISKAAWMQQIERDLQGRPIASLQSEWWPGAILEPLHHRDDHPPRVHLPGHLFATSPVIAEWVDARGHSAADLNKQLLEALRFGAAQIILTMDEKTSLADDAWLEGIHADMVSWHFMSDVSFPTFQKLRALAPENVHYRIRQTLDYNFNQLLEQPTAILADYKMVYHFPSSGNWVEQCVAVFNTILADADQWMKNTNVNSFFDHCILSVEAGTDYLKSIIQLRTLHVVWQNLIARKSNRESNKLPDYLESHIVPGENESPDHFLVRATTAALGSVLAGVQVLCIHPHTTTMPQHYRRINRNVHHLLHMESGLPKQCDPLAGAYAIDHYTADWSEQIWNELNV